MRALASPASLKGVLSADDAAAALASGMRSVAGLEVDEAPVADGGEGTAEVLRRSLGGTWRTAVVGDAFGRPVEARFLLLPDGTAVVESAEAVGITRLREDELDPLRASSAGVGELLLAALAARPSALLVCVGGTATLDGGAGLRSVVVGALRGAAPIRVACDVRNPLLGERGAARVFGPQKGATPAAVRELERRFAADAQLVPYRDLRGAGAGGGLGAGLAALGAELVPGAELVLEAIGFDDRARDAALVVTGEGTVDATTLEGKAPGAVLERCRALGVGCELFGGLVRDGIPAHALSGRPERAADDLAELGKRLGLGLAGVDLA